MTAPKNPPRLDTLTTPPIVGRTYLVPCAREIWFDREDDWPILLPFHEDKEIIGFEWDHAHIDRRFLTNRQYRFAKKHNRWHYGIDGTIDGTPLARFNSDGRFWPHKRRHRPAVKWIAKRAQRNITPHTASVFKVSWLPSLEAAYADCRLKPGLICPHRGAQLATLPPDEHGHIVCPMHGLKWNADTGELVRTTPTPTSPSSWSAKADHPRIPSLNPQP